MSKDDFAEADKVFPAEPMPLKPVEPSEPPPTMPLSSIKNVPSGMLEHKRLLLHDYHKATSLAEKLRKEGRADANSLVMALVEELVKESDSLLGNELLAEHGGNLRDATVISDKRAGVLERAIKAVQAKQEFDKEAGGFDVESPSMRIVFKFFMRKVEDAMKELNMSDEQHDIFFQALGRIMTNWRKDLKDDFEKLNSIGNK